MGYLNTVVYFADALNKYRLAITPRDKVYWTRPVNYMQEEDWIIGNIRNCICYFRYNNGK